MCGELGSVVFYLDIRLKLTVGIHDVGLGISINCPKVSLCYLFAANGNYFEAHNISHNAG